MAMQTVPFSERTSCTILEACSATGLSRSKLYEEIAAGRIKTAKVGGRSLVVVASLLSLITLRKTNQADVERETSAAASSATAVPSKGD
jgi:excisionase family DNA binding protein